MLLLTLCRVFKSMEPMSFDDPAQTEVGRMFLCLPWSGIEPKTSRTENARYIYIVQVWKDLVVVLEVADVGQ